MNLNELGNSAKIEWEKVGIIYRRITIWSFFLIFGLIWRIKNSFDIDSCQKSTQDIVNAGKDKREPMESISIDSK